MKKPSWDAWTVGKSAGVVLLLLPVLLVVGFAAQVVEALYYMAVCIYYVVASPYLISRTLWRALRPVTTEEHARRRVEAREAVRGSVRACGCITVFLLVLAVVVVGFVLLVDHLDS
ncbi:hypothetical protein [Peterkaempfera sp. SMS 1(5)a]|uniref:hypothetical protein n=1 Tax=Peterkaempfera podocarpi TaxID=3232308 RepID=UPI003671BEB5